MTALMHVSLNGYKEIVKLLLENGADVNKTNNIAQTALILASSWGDIEIIELITEHAKN